MNKTIKWVLFYCGFSLVFLLSVHGGSRAVSAIAESMPMEPKHTIILDAGHGGEDGGTTSATGRLESAYNLEISLCLGDLLNFLGYHTQQVRTADISVYTKGKSLSQKKVSDLKNRVQMVNSTDNAVLVSIHQNHFSDSRYSGAQVFYAGTSGSDLLAKQLQAAFVSHLNPGSRRAAKRGEGIYLLEHIQKPGILIECGFLSNTEEAHKLSHKPYQQKLCGVIATELARNLSNT